VKIGLIDILKLAGFDPTLPTKLVRHTDRERYPVEELIRCGWLDLYQSYQDGLKFHHAKQIVSFSGLPGSSNACFYGVYKVLGHRSGSQGETLSSCPWSHEWKRDYQFFYDLQPDTRFADLRDRLIIDWGKGAINFVRNLNDSPVLEILPSGRKLPPFGDYLEFSLTYSQLKDLFRNETAHRDWQRALSAVAGVYLILARTTGDQYVGSAAGKDGIWGRWRTYADTGHGDNDKLRELIASNSDYPEQFLYSVLHVLPKTLARIEVVKREMKYMVKLGTRTIGLN